MTRQSAQMWIFGAWLGAVGLVTLRQIVGKSQSNLSNLPNPSVYLGSAVIFTILGAGAFVAPGLAAVLAVGTDVGLIAAPYLKGSNVGVLDQAATWLSKASGEPVQQASTQAQQNTALQQTFNTGSSS